MLSLSTLERLEGYMELGFETSMKPALPPRPRFQSIALESKGAQEKLIGVHFNASLLWQKCVTYGSEHVLNDSTLKRKSWTSYNWTNSTHSPREVNVGKGILGRCYETFFAWLKRIQLPNQLKLHQVMHDLKQLFWDQNVYSSVTHEFLQ